MSWFDPKLDGEKLFADTFYNPMIAYILSLVSMPAGFEPVVSPNYITYYDVGDSEYKAKNGLTGAVQFNNVNALVVTQAAINAIS